MSLSLVVRWADSLKKAVTKLSEQDLLRTHRIRGQVPGWFFRVRERSQNHWEVEGLDQWGRRVAVEGSDPERLLVEAEALAQKICDDQSAT